jgi:hypothetical protein
MYSIEIINGAHKLIDGCGLLPFDEGCINPYIKRNSRARNKSKSWFKRLNLLRRHLADLPALKLLVERVDSEGGL